MSFLGGLAHGIGSLAKKAAPFAAFVPGVGPALSTGLELGGQVLDHGGSDVAPPPTSSGPYNPSDTAPTDAGGTNKWLMGLAGLEGLNSAYLGHKASNLSNDALASVKNSYAERAPLRKAGMSGLLHPVARDTSELTRIRGADAYAAPSSPTPLPLASGRVT